MPLALEDQAESYSFRLCRCGAPMQPDEPQSRWTCQDCGRHARR